MIKRSLWNTAFWLLLLSLLTPMIGCKSACRKKAEPDAEALRAMLTHLHLGIAYLEESRLEEAKSEFSNLVRLAPDEAVGYANLGLTYLRLGNYTEAESWVLEATKKSDDPDIRLILADVYERSSREEQAIQVLLENVRNHPEHARSHYRLSQLYDRTRATDRRFKMEPHLKKVVELLPANLLARLQLIEVLIHNDKPMEAAEQLELVRKQVPVLPDSSPEFLERALFALQTGKSADALPASIAFHNLLKPMPLYQASVIELNGPGGASIGFPILHFSEDFTKKILPAEAKAQVLSFEALPTSFAETAATSVALVDFDGDNDPDLFVTGTNRLFRNDGGKFTDVTENSGIEVEEQSRAAVFGDYDNDGNTDLFVLSDRRLYLFQNRGGGQFVDASSKAGFTPIANGNSVLLLDLDMEGDLDVLLQTSDGVQAYRNNSDGTFTDITMSTGLEIHKDIQAAVFADFDEDGDPDLLFSSPNGVALFTNQRQGRYQEITSEAGLPAGPITSVAVRDYDNDGFTDILITGESAQIYRNSGKGTFDPDTQRWSPPGIPTTAGAFGDYDNDGHSDILVGGSHSGVLLFRNPGTGKFQDVSSIIQPPTEPVRSFVFSDLDTDGDLDIILLDTSGKIQILRNNGGNANHWLRVQLIGLGTGSGKNNREGIAAKLEVMAGELYQMRTVTEPVTYFGLGHRSGADVLRIVWTNGVPQSHFHPKAEQTITEEQVLKGSCAFLYTWNGEQYTFLTDIMWKSALGMPLGIMGGDTAYAFPNSSDEYLRIPGNSLQPKNGKYSIRITEELWETSYLDQIRLLVLDHPKQMDIYLDERFVVPPFPPLRVFPVRKKLSPASATDEKGNNVLPLLLEKDNRYVANLQPSAYQGITSMHDLVLSFDDLSPNDRIVLFLNGWIFPSDASINVATSQSKLVRTTPPYVQVPDANGQWQTVIPNMSFPMGKNKTMAVDLSGKFLTNDFRIRIRTNMEIYWDHIFYSRNEAVPQIRKTTLEATSADLHYRGFSRMYRRTPYGPHWFDYQSVTTEKKWRDLEGQYTRYGDVTSLLQQSDDRYVISNAGDEISIEFDAGAVPPIPEGWSRDFLLYSDGWIKDGDSNTAYSKTVGPLPFHGMKAYPYSEQDIYPDDRLHREYLETYNTRKITNEEFRLKR